MERNQGKKGSPNGQDSILYQQYQQNNENTDSIENSKSEKGEKIKNFLCIGLLVTIATMIFFLVTKEKITETEVVYREAVGSKRVITSGTGTVTQEVDDGGVANKENLEELYAAATELDYTGTKEEFNQLIKSQDITIEELRSDMSELEEIIRSMEGQPGVDGRPGKDGMDGQPGIAGRSGKDGRDGKEGKEGEKGEAGKDGLDGKDGVNGQTTFIAYAEDAAGKGFSLTPTENSKCIGTCMTMDTTQPMKPASYTWQVYRTYIITSAVDDQGVTTLYIK